MTEHERERLKQKLLSRIVEVDGPLDTRCWVWTSTTSDKGYGQTNWKNKLWLAHRLSYTCFAGPISDDLHCLHKCDQRDCIRPEHLYLGTNQDNMNDRESRGRSQVGEGNGHAYLTELQAAEIKFLLLKGYPKRQIAEHYRAATTAIYNISRGSTWKHVEPIEPASLPIPKSNFVRRI